MDWASLAAIITAGGSVVLGAVGLHLGRKRDTSAAEFTAKSVATEAAEAALAAMKAGLDYLTAEVGELRIQVRDCEDDKAKLTIRVHELEAAR